ncbi:MAG: shikimate kinase [Bacillota bacterium]|nr:shikimate kinase [Bacillota bacterium]
MQQRLAELRDKIAACDAQLLEIAARRQSVVAQLGALKREGGLPPADPERERQLWQLWRERDGGAAAARLFLELTGTARQEQRHGVANLYIIGMPSAGKSSVGAAAARLAERPFCDMDTVIALLAGRGIDGIFAIEGEDTFRRWESELLALLSRRDGMVIACGGGVIKRELNRDLLRGSGRVLWLRREREASLDDILRHPRPLTQNGAEWDRLYQQRLPLYQGTAHHAVDNDADIETVAARICALLGDE